MTGEHEHRLWEIEVGIRCGCEHLMENHDDQGDGYLLCRYCGLGPYQYGSKVIWWGCVIDTRDGCGIAATDYAKMLVEPGPDAYRWSPSSSLA